MRSERSQASAARIESVLAKLSQSVDECGGLGNDLPDKVKKIEMVRMLQIASKRRNFVYSECLVHTNVAPVSPLVERRLIWYCLPLLQSFPQYFHLFH